MRTISVLLVLLNFVNFNISFGNALQCVDENNNEVDWYILYKIPHIKKNAPNQLIKNGFAYLYVTSEDDQQWRLSSANIMDAHKSFLGQTLRPVFEQRYNGSIMHIFYNDERPSKNDKSTKGHTKGVIAADANGGFWLIHSVPTFPPNIEDEYAYPLSGTVYGQSVLCMSLDADNMNTAGTQLMYNQPQIYSSNISYDLILTYPNLKKVIDRTLVTSPPWYSIENIKTKQGMEFISFSKTRDFAKELYEDLVAPGLNSSLMVESWLNGPGKLPSNCSSHFSVKNIQEINLGMANVTFSSALDHSKWAVSADTDQFWTCIGDINRAEHQKKRGGGTACVNNAKIAKLYKSTIATIENCKKTL